MTVPMTPVLMFHHLWGGDHPRGQGAITAEQFRQILERQPGLISADVWVERARTGTLDPGDTCVSFDDGLKCQVDLARPVLDDLGLTALWFVYTAPLEGKAEKLELYRHVRTAYYDDVEQFYDHFFAAVDGRFPEAGLDQVDYSAYLAEFSFYSWADRKFRYIRDNRPAIADAVMAGLMAEHGVDPDGLIDKLWVNGDDLASLAADGHVLGLHSHSHPARIERLDHDEQLREYSTNYRLLCQHAGIERIVTMAHPCNSYNQDTIRALRSLYIELGFRSNAARTDGSLLELPRTDHAHLVTSP